VLMFAPAVNKDGVTDSFITVVVVVDAVVAEDRSKDVTKSEMGI